MWFFAGSKIDQTIIETGGRSIDFTDEKSRAAFISALSVNHGINAKDISLYAIEDDDAVTKRVLQGHEYVYDWKDGEISGIDFSTENEKRIIDATPDVSTIAADGVQAAPITFSAMLPDMTALDSSYNEEILVPMRSPAGTYCAMRVQFSAGICVKSFKTSDYGLWRIAAGADIAGKNARMGETAVVINATLVM